MSNSIFASSTRLSLSKARYSKQIRFTKEGIHAYHISYYLSTADSVCPTSFSLAVTKDIIIYFLFLRVLRCFNSPSMSISRYYLTIKLSHSEISGSKLACSYPELIAACHVLHHNLSQAIRLTAFLLSKTFLSASFNIISVSLGKNFSKFICFSSFDEYDL